LGEWFGVFGNDLTRQILRSVCGRFTLLNDRAFRAMITTAALRQISNAIANHGELGDLAVERCNM
jgi:hypothetical protein